MVLYDLEKKLQKGFSYLLLGGALGFSSLLGCGGGITEANQKPVAQFVVNTKQGEVPLKVNFNGVESYDLDGSISKYIWDFGDGTRDSTDGTQINHSYMLQGIYSASLVVRDNEGELSGPDLETIVVNSIPNQKPTALFTIDSNSGDFPLNVNADAKNSYDPDGSISKYIWDFGDGTRDSTSGAQVKHVYQNQGRYVLRLEVEDNSGERGISSPENIDVFLTQLAFRMRVDDNDDIWKAGIINDSLVYLTKLTTNSAQDLQPAWSPDGSQLSFTTHRTPLPSIFLINADGSNERQITPEGFWFYSSSWSQDGDKIATSYIDQNLGTRGIAVLDISQGTIEKIIEKPSNGTLSNKVSWSTNGKIYYDFYSDNGSWDIFSVNPDGSEETNLTNTSSYNENLPNPSQDGSRIVYVTTQFGGELSGLEIASMAFDGSDFKRITNTDEMEVDPVFLLSDSKIIYSKWDTNTEKNQLYIANADGSNKTLIPIQASIRYTSIRPK
jgi:PKD repeat protein